MKNEQILKKAIEKTIKNGFDINDFITHQEKNEIKKIGYFGFTQNWKKPYYFIIFSHSFAKAFWGDKIEFCSACHRKHFGSMSDCDCGVGDNQESWQHHLQQMVLEEEPLKYIEKFL